jgi:hypothetical protein
MGSREQTGPLASSACKAMVPARLKNDQVRPEMHNESRPRGGGTSAGGGKYE